MPIALDAQESDRFGVVCARVIDPLAPLDQIDAAAREQAVDMLSLRLETHHITRVAALEDSGFRLMDTLVYYDTALASDLNLPSQPDGETIRFAVPDDAEAIGAVAQAAFSGFFGHFHADDRLQKSDATAVYVDWTRHLVRNLDAEHPVLVSERAGRPVGFLTLRRNSPEELEIVLNAVHPDDQGTGIYGSLIDAALRHAIEVGAARMIVSTQINNIAVQRAWGKRGFRMLRSLYTFHKWL